MTTGVALAWEGEGVDAALAVEALYRAEARSLIGMLTAYVGDGAVAEDLAQEAFLRVQRSWHRVRDPERAVSYLRATAFNLARSSFRRRLRAVSTDAELMAGPEDGLILSEQRRSVLVAVRHLPQQQRACVILRYYAELGIDDIGRTLGISPNSVKTHLTRALDALGASLGGTR